MRTNILRSRLSGTRCLMAGIAIIVLAAAWPAHVGLAAPNIRSVSVGYPFDTPEIMIEGHDKGFDQIEVAGLPNFALPGEPSLPMRTARLLVPFGMEIDEVIVTTGARTILEGSHYIRPGGPRMPLSYQGAALEATPDPDIYSAIEPFPNRPHSDPLTQNLRGATIVVVNLFPVGYVPRTGTVFHYESMDVKVTLKESDRGARLYRGFSRDLDEVFRSVDNTEIIDTYPVLEGSGMAPRTDYDYVIITSEALRDAAAAYTFQDLVDLKASMGMSATIVTTEWIYATYPGNRPDGGIDDQTRIRNFIIDAYTNWGTEYVLLGGDGDAGDAGGESGDDIIPARGFSAYSDSDIASDLYYSCLDGTFDHDSDGTYGEINDGPGGGEVDLFAEVYVGRAAIDGDAELEAFVRKTIEYETGGGEYMTEVRMVGEYIGFGGVAEFGGNYLDEIITGSCNHGYCTEGFDSEPFFTTETLYDRDGTWSKSDIIGLINSNVHIINHLGHANVDYLMKFNNSDIANLTNDRYFIGYSQGCYSGAFDNRNESGSVLASDCIAEHLTNGPNGAVAFLANSRYGWGEFDSTDGPSQHFDREFWDAVLEEKIYEISRANQDSKADNIGFLADPLIRWCYYDVNLFGDPALMIRAISSYGRVEFDASVYAIPDTAEIRLYDRDLDLNPQAIDTAAVECASDTEGAPETVVLSETGTSTQTFTGTIALAEGTPAADGVLQVSDGDEITATYYDADDGSGSPAVVTMTADVDATPPVIENVAALDIADVFAAIAWSTDENAGSVVYYGTAIPPDRVESIASRTTAHEVALTGLTETTTYYYAVESADEAGNVAYDNNDGAYYTFVTKTFIEILEDDFESGAGTWTHHGVEDEWELGEPAFNDGPSAAHSGMNCWGTDLDQKYNTETDAKLVSSIYPTAANSRLSFWHWYHIEAGYDEGITQVSTDGGASWVEVARYEGTSAGWVEENIDLRGLSGDLRIRFRMHSDSSVEYAGWYIDDVRVGRLVSDGIVYRSHAIADTAGGNGNGLAEPGEAIEMPMTLMNASDEAAAGVTATLSSGDACITITDSEAAFGEIPAGAEAAGLDTFAFNVDAGCLEGHVVPFSLSIVSTGGGSWSDDFAITIHHADCWDMDADGYNDEFCGGEDCDDSNEYIYPEAPENGSNGVDDDCDGKIDELCFIGTAGR